MNEKELAAKLKVPMKPEDVKNDALQHIHRMHCATLGIPLDKYDEKLETFIKYLKGRPEPFDQARQAAYAALLLQVRTMVDDFLGTLQRAGVNITDIDIGSIEARLKQFDDTDLKLLQGQRDLWKAVNRLEKTNLQKANGQHKQTVKLSSKKQVKAAAQDVLFDRMKKEKWLV